jgi:predicted RNase H-like HicB family nuclease
MVTSLILSASKASLWRGDSYEEALADVQSAIRFHLETFGNEVFEVDSPVLEVFVAETQITA